MHWINTSSSVSESQRFRTFLKTDDCHTCYNSTFQLGTLALSFHFKTCWQQQRAASAWKAQGEPNHEPKWRKKWGKALEKLNLHLRRNPNPTKGSVFSSFLMKRRVMWWHCQSSVIIVLYLRGTQQRYHDNWKWTVHSLLPFHIPDWPFLKSGTIPNNIKTNGEGRGGLSQSRVNWKYLPNVGVLL